MSTLLTAILLALMLWLSVNIYCMFKNYLTAKALRISLVVAPVSPENAIWIALQTSLPSIFTSPLVVSNPLLRYCCLGWEFRERYRMHQKLGDSFMLVTPARNWLYVGEPDAAAEIFNRSRDFARPVWMTGECCFSR